MQLYFNNQNGIEAETSKAILIKVPGSMKSFWMPKSMIYPTSMSHYSTAYIPDGFDITSAKSGREIDHEYLEAAFDGNKNHVVMTSHKYY